MRQSFPDRFLCFEVSVPTMEGERAYALLDRLTGMPIVNITEPESTETRLRIYFGLRFSVDGLRKKFKTAFGTHCRIRAYVVGDWKEKWKEGFRPRKVSTHLWICPSWRKVRPKKNEKVIYLDPGMAFGTGLHPTTRFVLKTIDQFRKKINSLIDIGTGSGVLAIGASLLGVSKIEAIDLDPHSIETARENAKKNKCKTAVSFPRRRESDPHLRGDDNIQLQEASLEQFKTKQKFDFVAANLESWILLRSKKHLLKLVKPGGWIAMTGIGNASRTQVLRHYQSRHLKLAAQFKGREWSGFCFQNFKGMSG